MTNTEKVAINADKTTNGFQLLIEGKDYRWQSQYITGKEIRVLGNLPPETALFLEVSEPWKDQPVADEDKINLGRPEPEQFYYKRYLSFTVNKEPFRWFRQYITGEQVRKVGQIPGQDKIFLTIEKPGEHEEIFDTTRINLALPRTEHFFSTDTDRTLTIIVNGTPVELNQKTISFNEVIIKAFGIYIDRPTMVYTVAFEDGPKQNIEGSLLKGGSVFIKNKMIFHATATDKS